MYNTLTRFLVFVMLHAKGAQESSISYDNCMARQNFADMVDISV